MHVLKSSVISSSGPLRASSRQCFCLVSKHLLKIYVHSLAVQDHLSCDFTPTRLESFLPLLFEPTCPNKEWDKLSSRATAYCHLQGNGPAELDRNYQSERNCSSGRCQTPTGILVLCLQVGGIRARSSCHGNRHQQNTATLW